MNTKKPLKILLRWTGRILLAIAIILLGLIAFGLIRESVTRNKYQSEYLPAKW